MMILFFLLTIFVSQDVVSQCTNNWLKLDGPKSGVQIGHLDIPGNKITVEASFNRIVINTQGNEQYQGDLVSKHRDPNDVNYLLRPDGCSITTDQGFFLTPDICDIDMGKTYYVAMVYDGNSLSFYRNGFLMSSIPASGDLFQNNWITAIGTTADLQDTNPNISLPNPTTQTGLLAY